VEDLVYFSVCLQLGSYKISYISMGKDDGDRDVKFRAIECFYFLSMNDVDKIVKDHLLLVQT